MFVIRQLFRPVHIVINQFTACLFQSGSFRIGADDAGFQILYPLLKRGDSHFVELIHTNQEVFGEDFGRQLAHDGILLLSGDLQKIACMHAHKGILTVVQVIVALANVEIENADGVYLLHLGVKFSQLDMLRDGLGNAEEDALQIVYLARVLHLDDNDFILTVARLDVHTVELIVFTLLVALAFQYLDNADRLAQQHGEEAFEHAEVGFVAQQALHRPVKTYISVFLYHNFCFFCLRTKVSIISVPNVSGSDYLFDSLYII